MAQRAQIKAGGETRHQTHGGFHGLLSAVICDICGKKWIGIERIGISTADCLARRSRNRMKNERI
jgi:hypothetical protein